MAGSAPARDVPDLENYAVGPGTYTVWNGPNTFAERFMKWWWDYQLDENGLAFMSSNPNIGDGKTWRAVRPLGIGGFGKVGLWHAVDADGNIVDEMAIKQVVYHQQYELNLRNYPGLAKEAILQYQFNQRNPDDAVHLRRYKYYEEEEVYRLYVEYCPHGDLYRLHLRYRCWTKLFPELFMWHVFHSLSRAIASMEGTYGEGPWTRFGTGQPYGRHWYMLHLDLKPPNVFLSEPATKVQDDETDPTSDYPAIKLGDFGLAEITATEDRRNPAEFWQSGTQDYFPPEQSHFGVHWENPPNFVLPTVDENSNLVRLEKVDWNDANEPRFQPRFQAARAAAQTAAGMDAFDFLSAHNVWGVGRIMWDLMTLQEPHQFDERMDMLSEGAYKVYPPQEWPRFEGPAADRYTARLRDLVSSCLRIEMEARPTPEELERATRRGLRRAKEKVGRDTDPEQYAVYYRRNDITHMRPGNVDLDFQPTAWAQLVGDRFVDKSWDPLIPTSAFRHRMEALNNTELRPGPNVRPWRMEPGGVMAFNPGQLVDGKMVFQKGPPPPPPQQQPVPAPIRAPARAASAPVRAAAQAPVQLPVQVPVQAQPTPGPPPQKEDYEKLRIQELTYELKFERRIHPDPDMHRTKAVLVQLLMDADAQGNRGRGAVRMHQPTYKTVKRKWHVDISM